MFGKWKYKLSTEVTALCFLCLLAEDFLLHWRWLQYLSSVALYGVSHKLRAIGEICCLAKFGKYGSKRCCKSCVSNLVLEFCILRTRCYTSILVASLILKCYGDASTLIRQFAICCGFPGLVHFMFPVVFMSPSLPLPLPCNHIPLFCKVCVTS